MTTGCINAVDCAAAGLPIEERCESCRSVFQRLGQRLKDQGRWPPASLPGRREALELLGLPARTPEQQAQLDQLAPLCLRTPEVTRRRRLGDRLVLARAETQGMVHALGPRRRP